VVVDQVDLVLTIVLVVEQAILLVQELHFHMQVDQKVVPLLLDTTEVAVVVPVDLVAQVAHGHQQEVLVVLDMNPLQHFISVMAEAALLDGLITHLTLAMEDLLLVVVLVHTIPQVLRHHLAAVAAAEEER
jgi:hypothetical protein|tara:strand:+ start:297 stop:689 length:393 start_codon:yes stop_codon:yes gene_type:complete